MEVIRTVLIDSWRPLRSGYRHFLAAIALNWALVGIAAAQVRTAPLAAQTGLFLTGVFFYTAAASRATGFSAESPFWLALSRAGACIEPILVTLVIALVTAGLLGAGALGAGATGAVVASAISALFALIVLARVWPLFSVPFLFRGDVRWSPSGRGSIWTGPGLDVALRATREATGAIRASATFLGVTLALALPLIWLRWVCGPSHWLDALFFAGALPYLALVNFALTRALVCDLTPGEPGRGARE